MRVPGFLPWLLVPTAVLAARALGRSLRLVLVNRAAVDPLWAAGTPVIYAAWHGRMLLLPYLYVRLRGSGARLRVLASRSRDGELLSRFVAGFGVGAVRGSTSRGGSVALRVLARLVRREGVDVAVVPDGPRGPRHVAQGGPVLLASLTGAPLVPVGFGAWPGRTLRSWDACLVPYPFARAALVFGDPLLVPAGASREALEAHRRALEDTLRRVTAAADRVARDPAAAGL